MPKICIIGPKVDSGQHQNVFEHFHTHFGQANGQPREKEAPNTFVVLAIRTPALFNVFFRFFYFSFRKFLNLCWRAPKSLVEPTWGFNYVEVAESWDLGAAPDFLHYRGVEGRARSPGIRLGKDQAIWSRTCIQNQHKLVRTHSACIRCWDKPWANSD
jgi:hypothetical protein